MKPERYRVAARLLLGCPAKGLGSPVGAQTLAKRSHTPPSAAKPPKKPPERRPRQDVVHSSVYLPEAVYEALREAAFKERCKIHDLIMEGVGMALRKRGYPAMDDLKSSKQR
jgi:hypothetical protein